MNDTTHVSIDTEAMRRDLVGGGSFPKMWGEQIFAQRHMHRWSQTELARMVGVTRQAIHRYEIGESAPELHIRYALCDAFGRQMHELFAMPTVHEARVAYPVAS